jgi:CubicO group peptidase (beta-lactamase class C family)
LLNWSIDDSGGSFAVSRLEAALTEKISEYIPLATPGICIQAYLGGRKKLDLRIGRTYDYYDWASLTKIVFSTTQVMLQVDSGKLKLQMPISNRIPWFASSAPLKYQRIRDLLTHSAGLTWWKPFYQDLDLNASRAERWQELLRLIEKTQASESGSAEFKRQSVYSDLDILILGEIFRDGQDFYNIWKAQVQGMGLEKTHFHKDNKPVFKRSLYAPTEQCGFRGRVIQGEVHDENTWGLGGVAPHAGLFGPLDDLSQWGLMLRKSMRGTRVRGFAKPETVRKFAKRAVPRAVGDWGLGFMMPTRGSASCGKYFSSQSVGHTGFTGTSLWYDPKHDLLVTILSNRVHPTRENTEFVRLRPMLHEWIFKALE